MTIDDLFPVPRAPPSNIIPRVWAGPDAVTTTALRGVLKDNHSRWHIFFDERGFHNHIAHHQLAIWALGAPADALEVSYKIDSEYQRPMGDSPGPITVANFKEHLGKHSYYPAYLAFFTEYIHEHGIAPAVEHFVFSSEFNRPEAGDPHNPDMLGRFLGGLVHPMIHVGYGFEFCLPGMVAEGLAMAATHRDSSSAGIPPTFFPKTASSSSAFSEATARLNSLVLSEPLSDTSTPRVHTFTVLSRILADPDLANITDPEENGMFTTTVTSHASTIAKHMLDWDVDGADERDVQRRVEELSWLNSVIYAVSGRQKGKSEFNADFFHMHLVTSSLFLPSFTAFLSPRSLSLLLRGYLFTSLAWYISRGRPPLDITHFYASTTSHPPVAGPQPSPHKDALLPKDPDPNRWFPIIQNALVHPDDHLPKIQRAFAHYGNGGVYGGREKGWLTRELNKGGKAHAEGEAGKGLKGLGELDGTLFLRAAALTEERMGRVRSGGEPQKWDREGFYQLQTSG